VESLTQEEHPHEKVWYQVGNFVPNAARAKTLDAHSESLLGQ
jgi:hypothetical protein